MSWDVSLIDDRGHIEGDWNYTHNTNPMICAAWDDAGIERPTDPGIPERRMPWWMVLDGMTGPEGQRVVKVALDALEGDPARFDAMNPKNGWGDRASLVVTLRQMVAAVPEWPTTWSAHG